MKNRIKFNASADMIVLAYSLYTEGDTENALKLVTHAFKENDMEELATALMETNSKTSIHRQALAALEKGMMDDPEMDDPDLEDDMEEMDDPDLEDDMEEMDDPDLEDEELLEDDDDEDLEIEDDEDDYMMDEDPVEELSNFRFSRNRDYL
jgi:hypothetical protein